MLDHLASILCTDSIFLFSSFQYEDSIPSHYAAGIVDYGDPRGGSGLMAGAHSPAPVGGLASPAPGYASPAIGSVPDVHKRDKDAIYG